MADRSDNVLVKQEPTHEFVIPAEWRGQRLDKALATLMPEYSRARLQAWLRAGAIRVDDRTPAPRKTVVGGERVVATIAPEPAWEVAPQAIPLSILHEDEHILVVDKPAGLVVHPGAGNPDGTLQNALLHHTPELAKVPRGGIVHRLDKHTSGIMVVAKDLTAHKRLVEAMRRRRISREYEAVVCGVMTAGGVVDAPIGRHPVDRKRMHVREGGRPAVTHFRVLQRFAAHTHVRLTLETGRTHQIRVHMQHHGYPLLGDPVYGRRLLLPPDADERLKEVLRGFRRQALHARRLALTHPITCEAMAWEAPMPEDMSELVDTLSASSDR